MAKDKEKEQIPVDIKKIGLRLKAIRKGLSFSNSDKFALQHGLDRAQYGKYEAGSQDLRISSLIKILDKIGYKLSDFFNEEYDNIKN
ncbi:helix-turn-helix domain-containing protein [Pedobacter sp. ASV28]|uniref:helix-turn-helix domain-containing protein n=1 Tax=Pedobacter sp. ASV28 TaxID=2795123 RepID=UPI0018ED84BA|nr:helix-turn-helix transcriptional regulator [Pedobacter sp. ASV28]